MSENQQSLIEFLRTMDSSRKVMSLIVVAGVAAAVWFVANWANKPSYVSLYQNLDLSEAAEIKQILDGAAIPNELTENGTEVRVPGRVAVEAQVALAGAGHAVSGRPGLELFDRNTWGMTDFTQKITQQRALEGELARSIGRIRGIDRAQVHLTLSETGPLKNLLRTAKAAVIVSSLNGGAIPSSSVEGIAQLVANSVPDLSVGDVVVLDNAGVQLTSAGREEDAITARQLERRRQVEAEQASKLNALLAPLLGPGQASIQVTAELNFEQVDRTVTTYDPEGQVIVSEQRSDVQPGNTAQTSGQSTQITNQFQNSSSTERVVDPGGDVMRLTVAIALNEAAVQDRVGDNPTAVANYARRIERMASSAVGINPARGDQISVETLPFGDVMGEMAAVADAAPAPGVDYLDLAERFSRPLAGIIGMLLLFSLAKRVLKPMVTPAPRRQLAAAAAGQAETAALPEGTPRLELPKPQPSIGKQIKDQIFQETSDVGESGAKVVRAWLSEKD